MTYQIPLTSGLIVDNFAGGGGASHAIERALGRPVNIAINHNPKALAMHSANHPLTHHECEDVFDVNPREICAGRPVDLAWFSPDCKHFSKAKGGKPVEKKIRGLAWVAVRWAATVKPRVIILENVEEFVTWGPVLENGMPCKERKGQDFAAFVAALKRLGYAVEWNTIRACDYGAPTIRKRLFLIARCDGLPIIWPEKTHGAGLIPYRTAAECIDWNDLGRSIFERPKPLADNTMRRIARGIKRFVIDAQEPFLVYVAHSEQSANSKRWGAGEKSVLEPLPTITGKGDLALVSPYVVPIAHYDGSARCHSLTDPMRTITAATKGGEFALVSPIMVGCGGPAYAGEPRGVDKAMGTLLTQDHRAIVTAFLAKHFGGYYDGPGADVRQPAPTILAAGTQVGLVSAHLMKMYGTTIGQGLDEPLHTVTSSGNHHAQVCAFLMKYYGTDQAPELKEPLHTVTTKDRFGLVTIHGEPWQIVDIKMRMLKPRELYNAQGFDRDYVINPMYNGKPLSETDQKMMCGNSVSPDPAEALVKAIGKKARHG